MSDRVRDPEAKRAAVLAAASARFADEGFRLVSTGAIARAAGVAEGTVFHHFGSKHQLLEAVIAAEVADLVAGGVAVPGPIDWNEFVAAAVDWIEHHPMVVRVWGEGDDRVIGAMRRGMQRGVVPALAVALAAGQTDGWCREGDVEWFAQSAFAIVGEALIARTSTRRGPDADEVARIVAAIVEPR